MSANNLHPVEPALLACDFSANVTNSQFYLSLGSLATKPVPISHPALKAPRFHYTPEQRERARRYRELHYLFGHPGHNKLCAALDNNLIPGCSLSSADYKAFHDIYGQCAQCIIAKQRRKSMIASDSPPATKIGQVLSIDVNELAVKGYGDMTVQLMAVDEVTGYVTVSVAKSQSKEHLLQALNLIVGDYNLSGHTVCHIHADAQSSLKAMRPALALQQPPIALTLSPPAHHAQRIERYIQTHNNRCTAVLASLPFIVPAKYHPLLGVHCAMLMNLLPNSRTGTKTPYELVKQKRPVFHKEHPFLSFGQCSIVHMGVNKRQQIATASDTQFSHTARSELGVCVGSDPNYPGAYLFALANGKVVERNVISNVQVIPHGWQRHPVILSTPLGVEIIVTKDRAIRRIVIQPGAAQALADQQNLPVLPEEPLNDPILPPPVNPTVSYDHSEPSVEDNTVPSPPPFSTGG